jgi:hypothetical protein
MQDIAYAIVAVVIVLLIICCSRVGTSEHLSVEGPALPGESYVRLYEGFAFNNEVFSKSAEPGETLYYRILKPINLKSIDINLSEGSKNENGIRGVSIWSVYPGDPTSSTEATGIYMSTYTDPPYAFRANSPKYSHILTVEPGSHVRMELEEPVKRIFMVINM